MYQDRTKRYHKHNREFPRSARFIDAYRKGLDGKQAAWSVKKYRGHRVIPEGILKEFENIHLYHTTHTPAFFVQYHNLYYYSSFC
ncbi:hypothetical protein BJ138DRAFT_1013140 [Hygrophoropsis aurantiaca]|uniref:Uncharacterized protein n=1 Tax=Hygrophoropsis aurantiaca TaxID=72124 RepID=A0ACB8A5C7_9AGAM|nr:hypothetical protein BJ138DRAFT_1013140 [Hygrophoropsis aurantiaca]